VFWRHAEFHPAGFHPVQPVYPVYRDKEKFDMARPKIGIFGAMMAVGGLLAWRWAQRRRASQANLNRDLRPRR